MCPIPYGPGSGTGKLLPVPVPWDPTYLSWWFAFLKAVGDRYAGKVSFLKIAAAGPTSVSAEMSLPDSKSDIVQWQKAGYTSQKYIDAWKQTFSAYSSTFPRQHFSLATYPGLPIPGNRQRDYVRNQVINLRLKYAGQFAVESDDLNGDTSDKDFGYREVGAHSGEVITGVYDENFRH